AGKERLGALGQRVELVSHTDGGRRLRGRHVAVGAQHRVGRTLFVLETGGIELGGPTGEEELASIELRAQIAELIDQLVEPRGLRLGLERGPSLLKRPQVTATPNPL